MNHKELLAIRVRPAEFARLLGVSKQTVSTWIRDGKVTINALDGLLDVRRAIQDVLRNTSPGRLRSRVLRQAVTDALELRENLARAEDRATAAEDRAASAEAALVEAQLQIDHLESWVADGDAHAEVFHALLIENAEALRAASPEAWPEILGDLSNRAWDLVDPGSAGDDDLHGPVDLVGLDAEDALDALDAAATSALRAFSNTEGGGE
ncbi:MAG: MerR family transcriptional regulator [Sulfuriferula sp.]